MAGKYTALLESAVADTTFGSAEFDMDGKGTVVTLYAKPITPMNMQQIGRKHPNFGTNPTMDGMIDFIIMKAFDDAEGKNKAFEATDKPFLMRLSTNVIGRLFNDLFGDQMEIEADELADDAKKN